MYDDHYGLTGRPFQLTPDPAFYFESATHRKAMAYLGYGLAQGEGFVVITGDIGAGKTTLVGHVMATIDKARMFAAKITSTQVDGDDILRLAAQAFGIATEGVDKAPLLGRVEAFLNEQARIGRRTLLIVDEAQNLPTSALEELRMLSNFQAGGQALLQIFLLGQPEFRDKLKDGQLEQLAQRVIASHHLDPMGEGEIGAYIRASAQAGGWNGRPAFTQDAFAALHAGSGGIPRRVNALAARVMLFASLEGRDAIDGSVVEAVAADQAQDDPPPREEKPSPETRARIAFGLANPRGEGPRPFAPAEIDPELLDRIAALETRMDQQDAALRRILTLLVDWVERDVPGTRGEPYRHSAA